LNAQQAGGCSSSKGLNCCKEGKIKNGGELRYWQIEPRTGKFLSLG